MPPETTGKETLASRVGERLRARRSDLGRTLSDVAGDAGVSVSYLSAVEHGASVPSLPVLARIVHALGLPLAEVLREEGQNRVRRDRLTLDGAGARWVSHEDLQLDVTFLVARPGDRGECPVPVAGEDVFVYVHAGALRVTVDGDEHVLRTGDALDAFEPGAVSWAAEDEPVASVWAAGVPRERSAPD
jgi:transcriptional regulator with XRE-family HTH domain